MTSDAPATRHALPDDIDAGANVRELFATWGPDYRWFVTFTSMLGSFATLLTGTIVNVAIPDVMGALGMTAEEAQWLSTGFLAATTVSMLLAAWSTETFGVRATYIFSMLVFLAGSVMGGLATSGDALIASRFVQGAGAGLMTPVSMLIIFQVFPTHRRGWAMGIYSIGVVLAPALGPALGGWLIDHLNWRYVFFIAVPFALVSIPMAMTFMPEREPDARSPGFDWTGVALISVFLMTLLTALSHGPRDGWGSDDITVLFAVAGSSGIAFVIWEARTADPMFDLSLFTNGRFLAASIVTFIIGAGLYGSTYLLPLFLQIVQGLKPTDSGVLMLPAGLAMAVLFPLAGQLSDVMSPRRLILFGTAMFGLSSLLMASVDTDTPFLMLAGWALIGRVGLSFIFPCLNAAAMRPLPLSQLAQGSGMINFLRQLGGAFGVNLLAILLDRRTSFHVASMTPTQTPDNAATSQAIERLGHVLADAGLAAGDATAYAWGFLGRVVWLQGHMLAYRDAFLVVASVFFLCLIPAWFMDPRVPGGVPERPRPPAPAAGGSVAAAS